MGAALRRILLTVAGYLTPIEQRSGFLPLTVSPYLLLFVLHGRFEERPSVVQYI